MGELLSGLYDDLLDDVAERRNEQNAVATSAVSDSGNVGANATQAEPVTLEAHTPVRRQLPLAPPAIQRNQADKAVTETSSTSNKVKYFIMKSNNSTNIDRSLASGVWSTQRHNEAKLMRAYVDDFEVRLIFSINQSGHFQGYAIMRSAIGRGPKHNIWIGTAWGGFFEVEWQLQHDFPFSRFEHLSNPLNEGKPVKFARDGQELPVDVGNEVVRMMKDIARANGLTKPVIPNQLKVDPYPLHVFTDDRASVSDRRDFDSMRDRGVGMGRGRGRGYRWDGYGRYPPSYGSYSYTTNAPYSYASRWSEQTAFSHPYPADYSRTGYPGWARSAADISPYGPSLGRKRARSPSFAAFGSANERSLYEMTYEEYLQCYNRVQERLHEVVHSGELWKALGMIPEDYVWTNEDQRRVVESGWFEAWFGGLVRSGDGHVAVVRRGDVEDADGTNGNRIMTEIEFMDFCQKFCGDRMQFNEDKIRVYYEKMDALRDLTVPTSKKARNA